MITKQEVQEFKNKERFMKFVNVDENTKCWNWTGSIKSDGYGGFRMNGTVMRSHRSSWVLFKNIPLPQYTFSKDAIIIRHKCNNRSCVNPEHLELGTYEQNMQDRKLAGRTAYGENHGKSKLTEKQVIEIKNLLNINSISEISKMFNVSYSCIKAIKTGSSWSWIR